MRGTATALLASAALCACATAEPSDDVAPAPQPEQPTASEAEPAREGTSATVSIVCGAPVGHCTCDACAAAGPSATPSRVDSLCHAISVEERIAVIGPVHGSGWKPGDRGVLAWGDCTGLSIRVLGLSPRYTAIDWDSRDAAPGLAEGVAVSLRPE